MLEIADLGSRGIVRTIHVAKTKALISFAVTAKLICVFDFAYAKNRVFHNEAHIITDEYITFRIKMVFLNTERRTIIARWYNIIWYGFCSMQLLFTVTVGYNVIFACSVLLCSTEVCTISLGGNLLALRSNVCICEGFLFCIWAI